MPFCKKNAQQKSELGGCIFEMGVFSQAYGILDVHVDLHCQRYMKFHAALKLTVTTSGRDLKRFKCFTYFS